MSHFALRVRYATYQRCLSASLCSVDTTINPRPATDQTKFETPLSSSEANVSFRPSATCTTKISRVSFSLFSIAATASRAPSADHAFLDHNACPSERVTISLSAVLSFFFKEHAAHRHSLSSLT